MGLDLAPRFRALLAHQTVEDAEEVEIQRLIRSLVPDRVRHGLTSVADRGKRVGNDEGTKGSAADDDIFPRLPEHADIAAHCHETAKERAKHDNDADEETHEYSAPFGHTAKTPQVIRISTRGTLLSSRFGLTGSP